MEKEEGLVLTFEGTHKGLGVGKFPDKKQWCLFAVEEPNIIEPLAWLSEDKALKLTERLSELFGH